MAKRYLIIKLRHHGDVLLTTPVVEALKRHEPDCIIDVVIYQETRDMLAAHPDISVIHTIDRQWKKQGLKSQLQHEWALLREVQKRRYDTVVCLADQWRAALLAKVSGASKRIGIAYPYRKNLAWQQCFTDLVPELDATHHIVEQNLLALQPLGLSHAQSERVPLKMTYHGEDWQKVVSLLEQQGWQEEDYVVVHPGSRWFFKCWDDDKTTAIVQKLLQQGQTVVLSAAPDERELSMLQNIQQGLSQPFSGRLMVLAGVMNLRQLGALIAHASLFIGVDSVPMHMAAATQTPCVALFGPTFMQRWRPWSDLASVVYAGDFGPLPHPNSIDVNTSERYLSAITVDAVWQAIETQTSSKESQ